MSFKLYLSFLAASVVLIYAPGPVNLLTMNQALRTGWRRALPCVWGGTLAVLLQLALTALCLNSLVHLNEHALTVLRWAGAAYLVWLGARQWLSRAPAGAPAATTAAGTGAAAAVAPADTDTGRALFWRGVATSGLNPKTLLFFPSFFPQFISPDSDWSLNLQFLLLATTFALLFAGGVASMALFSHRLSRALQRPARMRAMNRVTGGLLVGMGAIMAGWN
ncbi:LysE family translocator [Burkholderia sp. Bp8992]|uniref:LysE family translocator n=1 Tax=Burkholderia sp. Bp8992 TaxID=2184554 RepID=UPI000F57CAD2|nr:LysE family translocator [Burkholderia sp. Bp8992]RQS36365.1 LysE family translocator [Burkholderia sp. Bp8992]